MSLYEKFKYAKSNKEAIFLKQYFNIDVSWDRILKFLYDQSLKDNLKLIEKDRNLENGVDVFGNVLLQRPLWMAPQTGLVWQQNQFPEIKEFLKKFSIYDEYIYNLFNNIRTNHHQQ